MRTWEWPHYLNAIMQVLGFLLQSVGYALDKKNTSGWVALYVVILLGLTVFANWVLYQGGFWP